MNTVLLETFLLISDNVNLVHQTRSLILELVVAFLVALDSKPIHNKLLASNVLKEASLMTMDLAKNVLSVPSMLEQDIRHVTTVHVDSNTMLRYCNVIFVLLVRIRTKENNANLVRSEPWLDQEEHVFASSVLEVSEPIVSAPYVNLVLLVRSPTEEGSV